VPVKRELIFIASPIDPAIRDAANLSTATLLPNADPADLYDILAILSALLEGRAASHFHAPVNGDSSVPANDYGVAAAALEKLVEKIANAAYTVFVCEPAMLPRPHAALLIEALQRIAKTVNRTTRAGCLLLGGDDGALTVNQTITWLSGLPPRTRVGGAAPRGAVALDYDPHRYRTARLLARREVDLLLFIATFGPQPLPAEVPGDMPVIVFGHPANADALRARGAPAVFVPVATPGIDLRGHLFRTDGTMLVPLKPARPAALPALDTLLAQLAEQVAGNVMEKP
jgi:formylmethanofuran dehydrogenase subunit B